MEKWALVDDKQIRHTCGHQGLNLYVMIKFISSYHPKDFSHTCGKL